MLPRQRGLTDSVNTLQQTTAALEARVADNGEAVEAIDAFRRDTIARLRRLQERIDSSTAPAPATGTLTPTTP
jgi:hypothetical protein